ncbi:hypothetical protein MVEN_01866900 [Mycena venus]|uniref:F-box domain-containing protein n=1 Tax=Mycena venus TaxID=2733690 RepID=A0A8H7CMC0_9AGAR|nr:hypothetical protein MVEN_01866900 [Mycena venus]
MPMGTSCLLAQEIWDEILDHLDERSDLEASALVCRAFVPRAQMHLFRAITVGRHHTHHVMSASRLTEIISHSPHIISHIHVLFIAWSNLGTLVPIVEIPWSRLIEIIFTPIDHTDDHERQLDLIGSLVSLPTVRKISFFQLWDSRHLRTVLARSNPGVCSLRFSRCSSLDKYSSHAPTARNSLRPNVTSLELLDAHTIPEFLFDATGPVQLSRLAHVTFRTSSGDRINSLLHNCKDTIQSLDFDGSRESAASLDLGAFSSLSHITLNGVGRPLQRAIESSGTSSVRTIYFASDSATDSDLQLLDSIISAAKMPALQQVEVVLFIGGYQGPGRPRTTVDWTLLVEKMMPRLFERGILVIRCESKPHISQ